MAEEQQRIELRQNYMEMESGGSHGEPPWLLILLDSEEGLLMVEIRTIENCISITISKF